MLVLDPWDLMGFLKGALYGFGPWFPKKNFHQTIPIPNPPWNGPQVCHDPMSCQRHDCQKVRVLVGGLGCFMEDFVARKQVSQWKSRHEWRCTLPPMEMEQGTPEDEVESRKFLLKMVIFKPFFGLFAKKNAVPKTTMAIGSTVGILVAYKGLVRDSRA